MTRLLLTAVLALLAAGSVPAPWPIDPVPLRVLVESSALIVVADVVSAGEVERFPETPWSHEARLRVVRVLAGQLAGDEVAVRYSGRTICPAPPTYRPGRRTLAFLSPAPENEGLYVTTGLSYGTKQLSDADLAAYEAAIAGLLPILAAAPGDERTSRIARWQLVCLADPATRSEAWLDLGNGTAGQASDWTAFWGEAEHRTLVELFVKEPGPTRFDRSLLTFLATADVRDPRLPRALLDKALACDDSAWVDDYLALLARQLDNPVLHAAVETLESRRAQGESVEEWHARRALGREAALEQALILIGPR